MQRQVFCSQFVKVQDCIETWLCSLGSVGDFHVRTFDGVIIEILRGARRNPVNRATYKNLYPKAQKALGNPILPIAR